jgi:hypothetical protein
MVDGYQIDIDSGIIRSKDRGLPTQRRVFKTMPHSVKCKFTLSIKEWGYWQEWITKDAKGWFYINLPSMYAGLHGQRTYRHLVRLTSTVTIDTKTINYVTASVTLEVAPSMFKEYLVST